MIKIVLNFDELNIYDKIYHSNSFEHIANGDELIESYLGYFPEMSFILMKDLLKRGKTELVKKILEIYLNLQNNKETSMPFYNKEWVHGVELFSLFFKQIGKESMQKLYKKAFSFKDENECNWILQSILFTFLHNANWEDTSESFGFPHPETEIFQKLLKIHKDACPLDYRTALLDERMRINFHSFSEYEKWNAEKKKMTGKNEILNKKAVELFEEIRRESVEIAMWSNPKVVGFDGEDFLRRSLSELDKKITTIHNCTYRGLSTWEDTMKLIKSIESIRDKISVALKI